MYERFEEDAARAVSLAGDEARRLGHSSIGTEHLLLGLLAERGTAAARALAASGVSLMSCREKVAEALASRVAALPKSTSSDLPFTDRAGRTLDRAGKLALRLGCEAVRSEHVLLSLLDVEGTAGQVLRGLAVDPEDVRRAVSTATAVSTPEAEASPVPQAPGQVAVAGPVCGTCGSRLEESLDRVEMAVGGDKPAAKVEVFFCNVCGTAIGARRQRGTNTG